MNFQSTRDTGAVKSTVLSAEAIKRGLAPDGGLYMPQSVPKVDRDFIEGLADKNYAERAAEIMSLFLTDYDKNALLDDCMTAYGEDRFPGGAAPLVHPAEGLSILELWHGPTCAFKDMALQIMPRLLSRALAMTGETRRAHILVATSGDTGKAALEGYRDVPGTDITVFYPVDGVSSMQKRQMTTQEGDNVSVCAVKGNFDDAQTGVKRIFSDKEAAKAANDAGSFFSSANSINWGRLVPQVVYYFSAYSDAVKDGTVKSGEKLNFCVPTGNFGNIFAAYIAKTMGLPVNRLICASNSNCVLTSFFETGIYDREREFYKTMSPSMDILISSNLERLLFSVCGAERTDEYMKSLGINGKYRVASDIMDKIRTVFHGESANEAETAEALKETFDSFGYLADTHTSVALSCYKKYKNATGDKTPTVIVSTASPYKFPKDVLYCLGKDADTDDAGELLNILSEATGTNIPKKLRAVLDLPVRFKETVDPKDMMSFVERSF